MLRVFKLITSEEVVAEIEEETDAEFKLKNPCRIGIGMDQSGRASLQMQPMLIFSEQKMVTLKKSHVLYDVSVAIELQNKYNEVFGSGIVVTNKKPLII